MDKTKTMSSKPWLIVLIILAAIGVGFWIYQLIMGLGVTGMGNGVSWGLYIMNFMFFVGLSAGGLIVASSAHVFNIEKFKPVALPAVICSTVCICCAGLFVLIDLGGIQRIWRMLTGPNFMSPLLWDVCVITAYLVINILDIVFIVNKQEHKVEVLSRIALPVAILVHSVTAWIFGLEIAREGWYTAILGPIFVASACDSGLALLICALLGLNRAGLFEFKQSLMKSLSGLLAVFITVDAYFIGCELLTTAFPGTEEGMLILSEMFTGATAPFFWFEVICGLFIPFLILVFSKNREKKGLVLFASILVIAGVFCKRAWLLFTSFITPNVYGAAGIIGATGVQRAADGSAVFATTGIYFPTLVEIAIMVGVCALALLAFIILCQTLIGKKSIKESFGMGSSSDIDKNSPSATSNPETSSASS